MPVIGPPTLLEMLSRNATRFAPTWPSPPPIAALAAAGQAAADVSVMVLACSDPRVNVQNILGLDNGTPIEAGKPPGLRATVVRNAGGRADEGTVRHLQTLQAVGGARTIVVMHHASM